ncbi:alpha/beta hydrolase [Gilvimarinus polysaccharolyticus]|uniref:alpha/beta hydrolase n=1 Tax=Gilvimarinus polysaccharolyticus TaxID=863921 RepID=UPI000673A6DC|nr:alpha/beta fold hydrolase [Gilvimarinus polysaccharolyticus]
MARLLKRGVVWGLAIGIAALLTAWWLLTLATLDSPTAASNKVMPGSWQPQPCESDAADLTCGLWHTTDGQFNLPVVIIRYQAQDKQATPLLYLQGGPGAGADINNSAGLQRWRAWRDYAGLRRDLILLDRRGTGASQPRPVCHGYESFSRKALGRNLSLQQEWAEAQTVLNACLTAMPSFNPAHYGSVISATDINQLGLALGIKRWHVLGVSYGSRLALALDTVKVSGQGGPVIASLVLDSVYPPQQGGLIDWPDTLARALNGFYHACSGDQDCQDAWQAQGFTAPIHADAIQATLFASLKLLRQTPMQVDVRLAGLPRRVVVNDHRLLAAVFAASYHRHRWADVIHALAAIESRDRAPLARLMQLFVSQAFSDAVTSFTFMAVDCRDNRLGSQQEYRAAVARQPQLAPYLEGMWQGQICHQWPAGPPLTLPRPPARVALLAGEFDPITPVSWARQLHSRWPTSQLTEFKAIGHHVLGSKSCALAQLEDFLSHQRERWEDCAAR